MVPSSSGPERTEYTRSRVPEYGVELVIVYDALSGQAHDEAAVFCPADVVDFQQMAQQEAVIVLGNTAKAGEVSTREASSPGVISPQEASVLMVWW